MILYVVHLSHFDRALLTINLIIGLAICVRLLCYRKRYARHKMSMSVVAYLVAVAYAWMVIRILTGQYVVPVDWSEVATNAAVLVAVWRSRGNIARFLMSPAPQRVGQPARGRDR